jgi:hypothetical protein
MTDVVPILIAQSDIVLPETASWESQQPVVWPTNCLRGST